MLPESSKYRLYAVSDIHVDYKENWEWIEKTLTGDVDRYSKAGLIVAGDVTHKMDLLEKFLSLLKHHFRDVFFVPGNHELWVFEQESALGITDSVQKFNAILALCDRLGVLYTPKKVANSMWVVPLFSWYHPTFSTRPQGETETKVEGWSDFYCCKWPKEVLNNEPVTGLMPVGSPEKYFSDLNEKFVHEYDAPVITFSHFLPRQECLHPKYNIWFLPYVSGSKRIEEQLRAVQSTLHVFGHTHVDRDFVIDGVRYLQQSRKYPREQKYVAKLGVAAYHKNTLEEMKVWEEAI